MMFLGEAIILEADRVTTAYYRAHIAGDDPVVAGENDTLSVAFMWYDTAIEAVDDVQHGLTRDCD